VALRGEISRLPAHAPKTALDPRPSVPQTWGMARSLLIAALLLLLPTAAFAGEADEPPPEEPAAEPAEERSEPITLDLKWSPATSEGFTRSESRATEPATLRIICQSRSAVVSLDGQILGEAPKVVSGIEPGMHAVTVTMPSGLAYTRQVFVRGGSVEELSIRPGTTAGEEVAFAMRTVTTVLAVLAAIPAGATDSARLARQTEIPGLITNFDVVEAIPRDK
jgi:hypothetical protein